MNSTSALPPLLHMDECKDPNCTELDQLKQLQTTLDRFTDYDHYERCCDGAHLVGHHHEPCCSTTHAAGLTSDDTCVEADCKEFVENCDDCVEEHANCYEEIDVCEDECEQCEEECEQRGHDVDDCPQNHPTTRDNCVTGYEMPLPLLGPTNDFDIHSFSNIPPSALPCTDSCSTLLQLPETGIQQQTPETTFDMDMDHWQTFVQKHHCAPDPCLVGQTPQLQNPPQHVDPAFGFSFGCDPSVPSNQYPWQQSISQCAVPLNPVQLGFVDTTVMDTRPTDNTQALLTPNSQISQPSSSAATPTSITPDRVCQWLMPCGSICGATYGRTDDLKKHVKNSHGMKGVVTCRWKGCTSSFATEAALTGHISKKHLSFDEEGPWKCTFHDCSKSFMYKQVRDEHVASHTGGNRMHCPICHQWLNAEGSNFRRHMASHNPKNEHMKCRFESLGCRRRFPRLDNLRRHEACCKFGKRAAGVHHHHHHVHVGHEA